MIGSELNTAKADRRALMMLLAAIVMAGSALSYDAPLVVKITGNFCISDSDFGFLLALTTVVIAVASAPWGYMADKRRRVTLILISQGITAVSMILAGVCLQLKLSYSVFFAVKLLSGLGLAGIGTIATSAVIDTAPLNKRGEAFGKVGVAWVLGGAVGMFMPAICIAIKLSLGITYLIGGVAGLAFVVALFFVEEPRRGAQDEALKDTVGAGISEYEHHIKMSDLKTLLTRPMNVLLVAAQTLYQFPNQAITIWFVTFLMRNHGLTELVATQVMFAAFIGMPFGNAFGGGATDRAFRWKKHGRTVVMIVMAAIAPVFLVTALMLPFKWIYFIPLMMVTNFFLVGSGPGLTIVSLETNLPEHRGTISALMNICASAARALAWSVPPFIAGKLGGRYDRALLATVAVYAPLVLTYVLMAFRVEKDMDHVSRILKDRAGNSSAEKNRR